MGENGVFGRVWAHLREKAKKKKAKKEKKHMAR